MKNKIAFSGKIASGKTTQAKLMASQNVFEFHSFGNGIRKCFNDWFKPVLGRDIDKVKDRNLLEYIGAYARDFYGLIKVEFDEEQYLKDNGLSHLIEEDNNPFWLMHLWLSDQIDLIYDNHDDDWQVSLDTDDFWIRLEFATFSSSDIVIDDCRYPNELEALKCAGFKIVRLNADEDVCAERAIKRDGGFNTDSFRTDLEKKHATFDVDYEIDANKSIDEVRQEINMKVFGG